MLVLKVLKTFLSLKENIFIRWKYSTRVWRICYYANCALSRNYYWPIISTTKICNELVAVARKTSKIERTSARIAGDWPATPLIIAVTGSKPCRPGAGGNLNGVIKADERPPLVFCAIHSALQLHLLALWVATRRFLAEKTVALATHIHHQHLRHCRPLTTRNSSVQLSHAAPARISITYCSRYI